MPTTKVVQLQQQHETLKSRERRLEPAENARPRFHMDEGGKGGATRELFLLLSSILKLTQLSYKNSSGFSKGKVYF